MAADRETDALREVSRSELVERWRSIIRSDPPTNPGELDRKILQDTALERK
jgi:hypothetical protein